MPDDEMLDGFLISVKSRKNMVPSKILVHNMEYSLMSYIRLEFSVSFVRDKIQRR
jgi:hypothetical protein